MLDVHLEPGVWLAETRPFFPKLSHSRFFMGNYCCLLMPEFGSESQIERLVRAKVQASKDSTWSVKRNSGRGMILFEDEECDKQTRIITGSRHD